MLRAIQRAMLMLFRCLRAPTDIKMFTTENRERYYA